MPYLEEVISPNGPSPGLDAAKALIEAEEANLVSMAAQ